VKNSPAIAWLGYSIHGDEMSGADASLAVAYHLAAGTSADVTEILKNVVVVIDPMQNPDGPRARAVADRTGRRLRAEPRLRRDAARALAVRAREPLLLRHEPRLVVGHATRDARALGRDRFVASATARRCARDGRARHVPVLSGDRSAHAALPEYTKRWWQTYANDQAAAFDHYGWSYYTREWADSWYPGYTDSWGTFIGACGILYEQAHYRGQALRRASGEIVTYHDAVHRQSVASVANVTTLAKNREAALREYAAAKRETARRARPETTACSCSSRDASPTASARSWRTSSNRASRSCAPTRISTARASRP
jgi:hypothetical protein